MHCLMRAVQADLDYTIDLIAKLKVEGIETALVSAENILTTASARSEQALPVIFVWRSSERDRHDTTAPLERRKEAVAFREEISRICQLQTCIIAFVAGGSLPRKGAENSDVCSLTDWDGSRTHAKFREFVLFCWDSFGIRSFRKLEVTHDYLASGLPIVFPEEVSAAVSEIKNYHQRLSEFIPEPHVAYMMGPSAEEWDSELVEVSAYSPKTYLAGSDFLVQIYWRNLKNGVVASANATEADPAASRRAIATLATPVSTGDRLEVQLEAQGASIDDPSQHFVWPGGLTTCSFFVSVPKDDCRPQYNFRVRIFVNTSPVGTLRFVMYLSSERNTTTPSQSHDFAHRYKYAFLSYASADRPEVLKRAQALKAARIAFFQDILSLEPGDIWEEKLFEEIDRSDLFLLFWSSRARDSIWVIKEAEHALDRQKLSPEKLPDLVPVILEGPPVALPPDSLKHIHFNDPIMYVMATEQSVASEGSYGIKQN